MQAHPKTISSANLAYEVLVSGKPWGLFINERSVGKDKAVFAEGSVLFGTRPGAKKGFDAVIAHDTLIYE